jgi:hypothetical protein
VRRFLPSKVTLFILAWLVGILGTLLTLRHFFPDTCEVSYVDPSLTTCIAPWEE